MRQPLLFRGSNLATTTTVHRTVMGHTVASASAGIAGAGVAGSISDISVTLDTNPGGGITVSLALSIGGSTAVTLTFTDGNLTQTAAGPYSIADGDAVMWVRSTSGGTPAAGYFLGSAVWEGTNAQEGWMASSLPALSNSVTRYYPVYDGSAGPGNDTTVGPAEMVVSTAITITRLYTRCTVTPSPGTLTAALYVNGVKQDGSGGTPDTRMTHSATGLLSVTGLSIAVSAGDRLAWEDTPASTPSTSARLAFGIAYTPAVDGESVHGWISPANISNTGPRYAGVGAHDLSTTEDPEKMSYPSALGWTAKNLYVLLQTNTGASPRTRTVTVRRNNAATSITCTVAVGGTTASDTSNTQAFSAGDTFDFEQAVNSTPTNTRATFGVTFVTAASGPVRPVRCNMNQAVKRAAFY